ncbi:hypothetical protein C7H75_24940 (plasmid) [Prescottella equi]|nr:hypothetical protein C7H75_24940 [Prescottella equi]
MPHTTPDLRSCTRGRVMRIVHPVRPTGSTPHTTARSRSWHGTSRTYCSAQRRPRCPASSASCRTSSLHCASAPPRTPSSASPANCAGSPTASRPRTRTA